MRQAAADNSIMINALVYGARTGFHLTIETGGDRWFEWLEERYPDDVAWVKQICTRSDKPDYRGEHWRINSAFFNKGVMRRIEELKAKEYERLLVEFKTKAARVWAVFLQTL
jgi:hypothetical protein